MKLTNKYFFDEKQLKQSPAPSWINISTSNSFLATRAKMNGWESYEKPLGEFSRRTVTISNCGENENTKEE